jgi:uncharacterized protein
MKRNLISVIFCMVLCLSLGVSAFAAQEPGCLVYDEADFITDAQEAALADKLLTISKAYNAQIVVATVDTLDGGYIDGYISELYDSMGFGYGENHDGVLLLVCRNPREFRILSNGFAASAIEMGQIESITADITPYLSDGDYAGAFDEFADLCDYYLNGYLNGFPFNTGMNLLIALGIGLVAGLITASVLKGQLKSVGKQSRATVYVKNGSMQITTQNDLFLYRNVTRSEKPTSSSSSSSGSSGSSRNVGGGSY